MGIVTESTLYQMCITLTVAGYATVTAAFQETHHRNKRSLVQLCNLMHIHTMRGCYDYNNYGCFCGWGNAGPNTKPVDKVDACCRKHDKCYGEVKCRWALPQIMSFKTDCKDSPKRKHKCKCIDSPLFSPCLRTSCECDLQVARCFGRAKFNPEMMNFDRTKCQQRPERDPSKRKHRKHRKHRKYGKNGERTWEEHKKHRLMKKQRKLLRNASTTALPSPLNTTLTSPRTTSLPVAAPVHKEEDKGFWSSITGWWG